MCLLGFWFSRYAQSTCYKPTILLSCYLWCMRQASLICATLKLICSHCTLCYTEWTTEGCVTAEVNESVVTCNCNHLTNFAILVVSIHSVCVSICWLVVRSSKCHPQRHVHQIATNHTFTAALNNARCRQGRGRERGSRGGGGAEASPDFKLKLLCVQAVTAKVSL